MKVHRFLAEREPDFDCRVGQRYKKRNHLHQFDVSCVKSTGSKKKKKKKKKKKSAAFGGGIYRTPVVAQKKQCQFFVSFRVCVCVRERERERERERANKRRGKLVKKTNHGIYFLLSYNCLIGQNA